MKEHYFVFSGFKAQVPCRWVTSTPDLWDRGRNFLLYSIHPNYLDTGAALHLHNIDADGNGRGNVLFTSAVREARQLGATTLFGQYAPRGDDERVKHTRKWYESHGIDINSNSRLSGDLSIIYARCLSILAQHQTTFEIR